MDRKEIKQYFDVFTNTFDINDLAYSYFYYCMNELLITNKYASVIKVDESTIIPVYQSQGKLKFSYLPLTLDTDINNYKEHLLKSLITAKHERNENITINNVPQEIYDLLCTDNQFKFVKNDTEYIYNTEDYLDNDFSNTCKSYNLRKVFSRFEKEYHPIVTKLEPIHIPFVKELFENWNNEARVRFFRMAGSRAYRNCIDNFLNDKDYPYQYNLVSLIENRVVGFTSFYTPISKEQCHIFMSVHNNKDFMNLDRAVMVKCFRVLNTIGVKTVNFGGTLGLKGLENFKNMLAPYKLKKTYKLIY